MAPSITLFLSRTHQLGTITNTLHDTGILSNADNMQWHRRVTAKLKRADGHNTTAHAKAYIIDRGTMSEHDVDVEEAFELYNGFEDLFRDEIFWDDITHETFIVIEEIRIDPIDRRKENRTK